MKTQKRGIFPNNFYHVYNRATERRTIFYTEKDYNRFLEKVFFYRDITGIQILSYALLPNHFHFLLKEPDTSEVIHLGGVYKDNVNQYFGSKISKFMSLLSNSYTRFFNEKHIHSGRIFQGKFKFKFIKDDIYLQSIVAYINLNPIKHKLVKNIEDWVYTSHLELSEIINTNIINNKDFLNEREYKEIIKLNLNKIKKVSLEFD